MSSEMTLPLKERIKLSASRREESIKLLAESCHGSSESQKLANCVSAQDGGNSKASALVESSHATAAEIAEKLFKRAGDKFLLSRTAKELANIASSTHLHYLSFLKASKPFSIKVSNNKNSKTSTITFAISDRPFVVDTISEYFRQKNIHTTTFLHPIISSPDDNLTSLAYIELDKEEDDFSLQNLKRDLEEIFTDLILVTEDFQPIKNTGNEMLKEISTSNFSSKDQEVAKFLEWLISGGLVFQGLRKFTLSNNEVLESDLNLGIFRSDNQYYQNDFDTLMPDLKSCSTENICLFFDKSQIISRVHRRAYLESIVIYFPKTKTVFNLLGLLTSKAVNQEAASVPLIREKLKETVNKEGVLVNSHDHKEIVALVNSMPKSELFQSSSESLSSIIAIMLDVHQHSSTRIHYQTSNSGKVAFVCVVLVRRRYTTEARKRIDNVLSEEFSIDTNDIQHSLSISLDPLVRIHYAIPLNNIKSKEIDLDNLESKVAKASLTWDDRLRVELRDSTESNYDSALTAFYQKSFPNHFKSSRNAEDAIRDVELLQKLSSDNPIEASLEIITNKISLENVLSLRIYKAGGLITLSQIVPLLEFSGFEVISEKVTPVKCPYSLDASIYSIKLRFLNLSLEEVLQNKDTFLNGLKSILKGDSSSDHLNELLVSPGLKISEISILRSLQHYLWQLKLFASERVIARAIVKHPAIAALLAQYFKTKFDHKLDFKNINSRKTALKDLKEKILLELKSVPRITHDRALRALMNIIDSIVRTNAFNSRYPSSVAVKINCQNIEMMPSPRPHFETFVYSPRLEGVHLRGGMVSRGGLRWSERSEDYRTEVLGLMKTQRVKNAIIIPVGAKGGFVIKNKPSDPQELRQAVETCYKEFITCLLELSDNRKVDKITKPKNLIIYDNPDPYLVVAADKGTATFSDLANSIASEEFNFWLDDAFASGGSNGYDHKKLGITAKGAWEAVRHHFREIKINPQTEEFTSAGIGDLSGDVFGNGMLLSNKMKLLGAFNHKHIFIDPDPNPEKSFAERERMFSLPRSSWTDYDKTLISKGGGIFDRDAKEIEISSEAKKALGIKEDLLSGEQLIKSILKAPVHLLWNGGIGTYIKSSKEDNLQVGDPSNDDVRIDAGALRAKIIGEGGNLGLTQLARIEYSNNSGLINTDAVDNSGGVDLSDQEVNFKILLQIPEKRGTLEREERNIVLENYANDFCEKVLAHNRSQCLALSLSQEESRKELSKYGAFLDFLVSKRELDRKGEFLPSPEDINKVRLSKKGLCRPELAIILAYAKMWIFESILESELTEDRFLDKYLLGYFPSGIVKEYESEILEHPLKKEIIATEIANLFCDLMGPILLHKLVTNSEFSPEQLISAFLVVLEITNSRHIINKLNLLNTPETLSGQISATLKLRNSVKEGILWILANNIISEKESLNESISKLNKLFNDSTASTNNDAKTFLQKGDSLGEQEKEITEGLNKTIKKISSLETAFVSNKTSLSLEQTSTVYNLLKQRFSYEYFVSDNFISEASSSSDGTALSKLQNEYKKIFSDYAEILISKNSILDKSTLSKFLKSNKKDYQNLDSSIKNSKLSPKPLPDLYLATDALKVLSQKHNIR